MKRVSKELLDYIADRAKASAVDDNAVRSQYTACQQWLRYAASCLFGNITWLPHECL